MNSMNVSVHNRPHSTGVLSVAPSSINTIFKYCMGYIITDSIHSFKNLSLLYAGITTLIYFFHYHPSQNFSISIHFQRLSFNYFTFSFRYSNAFSRSSKILASSLSHFGDIIFDFINLINITYLPLHNIKSSIRSPSFCRLLSRIIVPNFF